MEYLQTIYHYFANLPPSTYYHVGEFLLTGAGVQFTVQALKYWKQLKDRSHLLRFLNGAIASLVVVIQAFVNSGLPLSTMTKNAASLAVISSLFYRVLNSKLYSKFEALEAKASAYDSLNNPKAATVSTAPEEFTLPDSIG